ncbi:MAG: sulfotransferase [Rhodospirillales bacterium]
MNRAERRRLAKQQRKTEGPGRDTTTLSVTDAIHLAVGHLQAGRFDDAAAIFEQVITQDPGNAFALAHLGVVRHRQGDPTAALDLIDQALELSPDSAADHNNRGEVLKSLGRFRDAAIAYKRAIEIDPDMAIAHNNLGATCRMLNQYEAAEACLLRAIQLRPDYAEAYGNLGNVMCDLRWLDRAEGYYRKALEIDPALPEVYTNIGNIQADRGEVAAAIASHEKAISLNPNLALAHTNMGAVMFAEGDLAGAEKCFRASIAANPLYTPPYRVLTRIKKFTEDDDDLKAMTDIFESGKLTADGRGEIAFGLGKAYEDTEQYDKAFEYYAEANRMKRLGMTFDSAFETRLIDELVEAYQPDLFEKNRDSGRPDGTPIFILGMPRSGTTLIEQILSSHPDVFGAGELNTLNEITHALTVNEQNRYPTNVNFMAPRSFENIADHYLASIRKRSPDSPRITDKMPVNYRYIGLIRLILPNAKIIHCRRNPMDTCLSIFKNHFATVGHHYAYDLEELGFYYRLYERLMAHWRTVLPAGTMYEVDYEDVTGNQESQTGKLLDYCGLEWSDACLSFHENERPINTASAGQVRQPMYRSSVDLWRRFETHLEPLRKAIEG